MLADCSADANQKTCRKPVGVRAKRARRVFDGRTQRAKRLRSIAGELAQQFGLDESDQKLARAAELSFAAEQARRALIRRDPGADVAVVVKIENLAARAARDLVALAKAKPGANQRSFRDRLVQEREVNVGTTALDASAEAAGSFCGPTAAPVLDGAKIAAGEASLSDGEAKI